jgi:hypothetical protein
MSRLLTALLVVGLSVPDALLGQKALSTASISPGTRVRITQIDQKPRVAVVVSRSADTLLVRWPDLANTVSAVPVSEITRLQLSNGRHRKVAKGMLWGSVGAGTAGAILGAATYSPCNSTAPFGCLLAPEGRFESAMMVGVVGGVLGLVVGGLVGLPSRDDWRTVPLDAQRVALSVKPRGSATGIGVSLRF